MEKNKVSSCVFGERRVSALIFPCTVSLILSAYITVSVLQTRPAYGIRMMTAALALSLIWAVLFALDCRRAAKGTSEKTLRCPPPAALILSVSLGFYLAYTVWGSGYLSLAPLEQLDNGTQHLDTLFLSSIAESFRQSPVPRVLLNNEAYIPYHYFSNLLMAGIAGVLGTPAYIVYNYMYPALFLPAFLLAQIMAIHKAKEYFSSRTGVGIPELAVMILVNVGFIYQPWLDAHGVWKRNLIVSESFLVASLLTFLSYGIIFHVLKHPGEGRKRTNLLLYVFIPVSIFLITWSKISTGLLYAGSVMYYLFRVHIRKIRCWGLNVLYGVILLAALWLFKLVGGLHQNNYLLWAFEEYTRKGLLRLPGHYLILLILPVIFTILEIRRLRKEKDVFRTAKSVWIEDLLLVALVGFLPGMYIVMDGGSAAYFSTVVEIPAMLLVCGHPGFEPEKWFRRDTKNARIDPKKAVCVLCTVWCAAMCWINKPADPMKRVTGEHGSNLSGVLLEVRENYGQRPGDYAVYLDRDNIGTEVFRSEGKKHAERSDMCTIYAWPALTGISVIDATHKNHVGNVYTYRSTYIEQADNYKGEYTDTYDRPLTLEEALEKAAERGKKGVIHVTPDGYEVLETGR